MDTPAIAAYYKEADPMKRRKHLERAIEEDGNDEANAVRMELWEQRYKEPADRGNGQRADGLIQLWMTMEFNRGADKKIFGVKSARKEIGKQLEKLNFQELREKSPLHEELLYRECCHLVKTYMDLCRADKNYNTVLCGILSMSKDNAEGKLRNDILETGIQLAAGIHMEEELDLIVRASREVYDAYLSGEE